MGSVAKKGLQQYLLQLQRHPLRTKMITAGVLSAVSDIVAQKLSGIQKLQLKRLLLKVIFGAAYLGPLGHYFHILLDKIFKGNKDTKTVAKKVVLEQLTISPWNNLMFMIYYGLVIEGHIHDFICVDDVLKVCLLRSTLGQLNHLNFVTFYFIIIIIIIIIFFDSDAMICTGRSWFHTKSKIKKEYPTVQYTAWTFWPVVGWVNHQYVPLQFRVILQSVVACFWGIFLNLRAKSLSVAKK